MHVKEDAPVSASKKVNYKVKSASDNKRASASFLMPARGDPPPYQKADGAFVPKRMFLRHTEETEEGFGSVQNYTTLGFLLAPEYRPGRFMPMLDLRVHNINTRCRMNGYGATVGLVTRHVTASSCKMIGFNAYWDYRQGSIAHWNQLGLGLEILGKRVEFHANGYWPLENERTKTHREDFPGGFYSVQSKIEYSYAGVNAELGWKVIRSKDCLVYAGAGPYYLSGVCDRGWGGKVRLRPQYKDFAAIEGSVSYDPVFGTIYQVDVTFSVPLYGVRSSKKKKAGCGIYDREIYQPVERWDTILLRRKTCFESNF